MSGEWSQRCVSRKGETTRQREAAISRLAGRQRQLVRADQLEALGLHASTIGRRVGSGRLHEVHPRVFALHPPPYSHAQHNLAATFACGPHSALSDLSAAAHLRLTERIPSSPHVTSPTGAGRAVPGITVHRRALERRDVWHPGGIPCTSPARTVVDCAASLDLSELEDVLMAADASGKLNRRRLGELVSANAGHRGIAGLRLLITDDPAATRGANERRMLSICREFGVSEPLCNHRIRLSGRTFIADFCWPDLRLIVEADSWRWHGGRLATESDRDRDQLLSIAGWRVVHFTRDQIKRERQRTGWKLVALTSPTLSPSEAPPSGARGPGSRPRRAA